MKRLILDLDETLCSCDNGDYANAIPKYDVIEKLIEYSDQGFEIVISTSRNVRTYNNSIGKINANTLPIIIDWLNKYNIPFNEIYVGKPWCGTEGFHVDDKSIRPNEFVNFSYKKICKLLGIS